MKPYEIVNRQDYIEIIIERDVHKDEIIATFFALNDIEGFRKKNYLWHVKGNVRPLNYYDSQELTKLIKSIYPADKPGTKHAFVCDSTFVRAASKIFVDDSSILAFVIKDFSNYGKAVQWLQSPED